jgi:hypothetical protein
VYSHDHYFGIFSGAGQTKCKSFWPIGTFLSPPDKAILNSVKDKIYSIEKEFSQADENLPQAIWYTSHKTYKKSGYLRTLSMQM